jgi:leucyl aminopeptidase
MAVSMPKRRRAPRSTRSAPTDGNSVSTIKLDSSTAESLAADALVIGVTEGPGGVTPVGAREVDEALGGRLQAALAAVGATGKAGEVTRIATLGALAAPTLVAVGLGSAPADTPERFPAETLRRAAGAATRALAGCGRVGLALPAPDADLLGAVAEGALLGAYAFLRYRSGDAGKEPVSELVLLTGDVPDESVGALLDRVQVVTDAVKLCRDLVNTPPSDLHPREFAEAAVAAIRDLDLDVEVLDEDVLAESGYGGITGVGQGSTHPPRLVRISYTHPDATRSLALVGKGITFDSGGLSLKPSHSMEWMKSDMGGAAAVISAMTALARLRPKVNVTAWAPMAENMPSGTAIRPSDVLTMYGGKTVEVLNTDAEGRLILADAIARASEDSPDLIVDVATLTGAQLVALGSRTAALMSNDVALQDRLHALAAGVGDAVWPMPLPEELRKSMDSEVADIANMGDRYGGMMVAALFLREFVGSGIKWAHLDIAGPAFEQGEPFGYTPKGGTGAAVRTLVRLTEALADGTLLPDEDDELTP